MLPVCLNISSSAMAAAVKYPGADAYLAETFGE